MQQLHIDHRKMYLERFGYQCVFNEKNEAIIITIGGKERNDNSITSTSIVVFNTITKQLVSYPNVCVIICFCVFETCNTID